MRITKLKLIRLSAGLGCVEMGRLIGIHPSQYSRMENNWERRVNRATNDKLVRTFGEGFDFLMEPIEVSDLEPIIRKVEKSVAA